MGQLLHEVQVYRLELEMQNEELRRAQLQLDAARALYFDLFDLAPVGYWRIDPQGRILESNLAAAAMLGRTRASLVGKMAGGVVHHEDQDTYYRFRVRISESDEPQVCELRLACADGTTLWGRLTGVAMLADDEEPAYRVVISDITEQRTLQASLEQNDRMASTGMLAAGVAHEINNPLTFVLFHLEALAEELPALGDSPALTGLVDRVRQALDGIERITAVASSLGAFSRVEAQASAAPTSTSRRRGRSRWRETRPAFAPR